MAKLLESTLGRFPARRPRRNRDDDWRRKLVQEHVLNVTDLVWPVFVMPGQGQKQAVVTMPDVYRCSSDVLLEQVAEAVELGITAVAVFPCVSSESKTLDAREALVSDNLICKTIRLLRQRYPELGIIADVALDSYTTHGHDGLLIEGKVANDATVEVLTQQALRLAEAGCQLVAPSDMMDGRVAAIRQALDKAGYQEVGILSYAAKYASAFYGPFRDVVGSSRALGKADKRGYQMDPANSDEAMLEVALDIDEGADMVLVKPAMSYLDVIWRVSSTVPLPVLAYQVSGEYTMLKTAAAMGAMDWQQAVMESLISIKRAGARAVFSYAAIEVARWLRV